MSDKFIEKYTPLRLIRLVKNMKAKELADIFDVTTSYIYAIEAGEKEMKKESLVECLKRINVDYERYLELQYFCDLIKDYAIPDKDKHPIALAKAIAMVYPDLESQARTAVKQGLAKYNLKDRTIERLNDLPEKTKNIPVNLKKSNKPLYYVDLEKEPVYHVDLEKVINELREMIKDYKAQEQDIKRR